MELVWFSAADSARLASFKAHYNIVLLTYLNVNIVDGLGMEFIAS